MKMLEKFKWSQGITLITANTKKWTNEQFEKSNEIERKSIFNNFNIEDEGRSRVLIATCENANQAKLIVDAVCELQAEITSPPDQSAKIAELQAREKVLVEALQNLVEDISKTHGNYTYEQAWINADEALANVNNEKKG